MADWYYAKNGQQQGPVNSAQLKQMASAGQIGPDDLVFREGGTQWVAASTVAGLQFGGGSPPAPAPVSPSRSAPPPARARKRDDFDEVGELPDDDPPIRRSSASGGGGFGEILMFRTFISTWAIIIFFWMGVVGIVGSLGMAFLYAGAMGGGACHPLFAVHAPLPSHGLRTDDRAVPQLRSPQGRSRRASQGPAALTGTGSEAAC